ncbi:MAG: adenylyl-sulfate kinase [Nitrospiraceae bacterium]|nr:adenylyl-sulfate kinase [Nitrospiraceae bacterium]
MSGIAIWITGLPGSGKSTVADAFKEGHPEFLVLRMDEMRKVVTPAPSYSDAERELLYRSLVFLAKKLSEAGHDVVIDATGNIRRWRKLARELIPGFIEVYLKCGLETCRAREAQRLNTHGAPKDIYAKGEQGAPVPGVNAPYEEPLSPELAIDVERTTAGDAADEIGRFLKKKKNCSG